MKNFNMKLPDNVHEILKKQASKNYMKMTQYLIQLILKEGERDNGK